MPFLLERKYFCGAYDFWWGYTAAQIDLMMADQPVIIYPKHGEEKMTAAKARKIGEEWEARRKARGIKSRVGKTLSFGAKDGLQVVEDKKE